MRPGTDDRDLRERVRHNIGNPRAGVQLWPGRLIPGRFGTLFDGDSLTIGAPPSATPQLPGGSPSTPPTPPPIVTPTLAQGRILGVALFTANGVRDVGVTDLLPVPCVIRALTIHGSASIDTAFSFRVLLAFDTDVSLVADPSGNDLIGFAGDLFGAEDPGVRAHLTNGNLVVEPWRKVTASGARVKLKLHNLSGATRNTAVYVDCDELT